MCVCESYQESWWAKRWGFTTSEDIALINYTHWWKKAQVQSFHRVNHRPFSHWQTAGVKVRCCQRCRHMQWFEGRHFPFLTCKMSIFSLHWWLFTDDTIHSLQKYILKKKLKKIIQLSLTFTKIGTFSRDFLFSTCYHSLRKPMTQYSHRKVIFPSTNIRTTPLDKQATPFPIKKKKKKNTTSLKAQHRKLHCFLEGSVQLHVPKSTWLPETGWSQLQSRSSGFGFDWIQQNGSDLLSRTASVLGSMCSLTKKKSL